MSETTSWTLQASYQTPGGPLQDKGHPPHQFGSAQMLASSDGSQVVLITAAPGTSATRPFCMLACMLILTCICHWPCATHDHSGNISMSISVNDSHSHSHSHGHGHGHGHSQHRTGSGSYSGSDSGSSSGSSSGSKEGTVTVTVTTYGLPVCQKLVRRTVVHIS